MAGSLAERVLQIYLDDAPPDEHEHVREAVKQTVEYQQALRADAGDEAACAYLRTIAARLRRRADALDPDRGDTAR